ncbi:MFS transporter [Arsenicicoccus sp. oral taxon 190]|uniref:MFS transporter n=1 Tax=Arsenicicoccus sp. oral taxon 190 TaxID=1658671 RepID=UPI000679EFB5|nr:MFS transporter [Arsenicicoccus sp. oral taxon 190]AKT50735.1 major facilitator transporter [Arsenicicoccus sp. oral taxon 190]
MSTSSTAAQPQTRPRGAKTLIGTGVGNALEWYDWNVYATFATYIAAQLFSKVDPTSAFLSTLAIFAVGFVARPFGGFVFGWLADRIGRKHSLMVAVLVASGGSLLIALAPTYDAAGVWSSLILLVARLLQGLAHGGELPSAQTYLAEEAPRERRGFWASSIYVSGTMGLLLGMFLGLVLESTLSDAQMDAWGWRVPFALGAVLGIFALWMRTRLEESEIFAEEVGEGGERAPREHILAGVWRHRRQALQVIGMTMGLTIAYYVWSVSTAAYAIKVLKFDKSDAFWAGIIGNTVFILALPVWGLISDRIGRKIPILIALLGAAVLYVPMTALIHHAMWQLALAISVMLVLLAAYLAIAPAVYAEMFPTDVRATGFGVPYAICIALFGGTAPYVQNWMASAIQWRWAFAAYAIVALLISAATVLTLPETRAKDLSH